MSSPKGDVSDPVRIAVIGVGTISRSVHLPLLQRSRFFRLRAVSDLDAERAADTARRHGAQAAEVPAILADAQIEAVLIATPGNHARMARDALLAGKHVLAEKPLSLTVAEATEVGALAERVGRVLQVGTMKTYDALIPAARQALTEIGDIRTVTVCVRHPSDAPQLAHLRLAPPGAPAALARTAIEDAEAYDTARVKAAVGDVPAHWQRVYRGVLCGSVLHETALLRALGIALPTHFEHADAFGWASAGPPSITATATLGADSRLVLSWNWLPGYPEYSETLTVLGTAGAVTLQLAPPYVLDARSSLSVVSGGDQPATTRHLAGHDGAFQRQLEAFAASVRYGHPVLADAAGAAADLRCLQALFGALLEGEVTVVGGEAGAA